MKVIRHQPHARWLPSRFRFAIFRLMAWGIFRSQKQEVDETVILGIDRDQSAVESITMAIWMTVVTTCFAFAFLERFLITVVAVLIAPVAAQIVLQLFVVWQMFGPSSWRNRNNIDINSFIAMAIITATALYFVSTTHWVRYVAWAFLGSLALNAIASVLTRMIPQPVPLAEERTA